MSKLSLADLWGLEQYTSERDAFRSQVLEHKAARRVALGPHATLLFEDYLTMKYQVQEMLRTERITDQAEMQNEIDAYNPMIPDGDNWKATLLLEYADVDERRRMLAQLRGVEDRVWAEVIGSARVFAIANEDMPRSNDDKTAAVHFLRFQLPDAAIGALKNGATIRMGIDHPAMRVDVGLSDASVRALRSDLDG